MLSKDYHRNSFTVAFNNSKRLTLLNIQREGESASYVKSEAMQEIFPEQKQEEDTWAFADLFE